MFFQDHEKAIYSPECRPDLKLDPLALDRRFVKATQGRLSDLLEQWRPVELAADGKPLTGDISEAGAINTALSRAEAEEKLVQATREAFELPPFPECTDGTALELLLDYLWWMEKKGSRGETPQTSPPLSESQPSVP